MNNSPTPPLFSLSTPNEIKKLKKKLRKKAEKKANKLARSKVDELKSRILELEQMLESGDAVKEIKKQNQLLEDMREVVKRGKTPTRQRILQEFRERRWKATGFDPLAKQQERETPKELSNTA